MHVGPGPAESFGPCGSCDQMQLWQEGPFDKVITFITVKDHGQPFPFLNTKAMKLLTGRWSRRRRTDRCQLPSCCVGDHHCRCPSLRLDLEEVSPATVGGLIYLLQLSTAMSAELYGIDPFTYPGIDNSRCNLAAQPVVLATKIAPKPSKLPRAPSEELLIL